MVDNILLIGIITAVITAGGIMAGFYWNARLRKDKVVETRESLRTDVEKTARDKFKEEQTLAQQLARQNKETATEVKQSMKEHIDRLIVVLKSDIELQRVITYSKIDALEVKVAQNQINLAEYIMREKDDKTRMQRSIDFLQTMNFGPEAKSMPDYILGREETQEHKDEPMKGVFASREDTTHKDKEDSEGNTTEEAEEQREGEEEQ